MNYSEKLLPCFDWCSEVCSFQWKNWSHFSRNSHQKCFITSQTTTRFENMNFIEKLNLFCCNMPGVFWKVSSLFWMVQRSLLISMKKFFVILKKLPQKVFLYQPQNSQVWKHGFINYWRLRLFQFARTVLNKKILN